MILLFFFLNAYIAYRYANIVADPDWAMFNMFAFTKSVYGRDFVDCKPPGIHIWYWLLAMLVGKNVKRVRFANHFLIGMVGFAVYLLTGNALYGLAFSVLVNSGWLLAFHGNVGQVPAALLVLSAASPNPWFASCVAVASVGVNAKLLPVVIVLAITQNWGLPLVVWVAVGVTAALVLYLFKRQWFDWIWEGSFVIPKRMGEGRRKANYYPPHMYFTAYGYLYILPWVIAAVFARPDVLYWLPVVVYMVFVALGKVIRPNHLLPIIPWIAMSGIDAQWILALMSVDYISAGLYVGNLWDRFYPGLLPYMKEARRIGLWLKNKPGTVWVNGFSAETYIYAEKPVPYGMTEHKELNGYTGRRNDMTKRLVKDPPDWIVVTDSPGVDFKTRGYVTAYQSNIAKILEKV